MSRGSHGIYAVRVNHGKLTRQMRNALVANQKNICALCFLPFYDFDPPTIDHCIPLGRGGVDDYLNMQAAHLSCNQLRGDMLMERWFASVKYERQSSRRFVAGIGFVEC